MECLNPMELSTGIDVGTISTMGGKLAGERVQAERVKIFLAGSFN